MSRPKKLLDEKPEVYWKRPDNEARAERTLRKIHYAVGKALSSWEWVELTMARLYGVLIESQSIAALRSYGSIIQANGRKSAIEAAGKVYFWKNNQSNLYEDFLKICHHYGCASGRRNDIAHGIASTLIDKFGIIFGCFLIPPPHASRHSAGGLTKLDSLQINISDIKSFAKVLGEKIPFSYAFNADTINGFDRKFHELRRDIIVFTKKIDKDVADEMKGYEFRYTLSIPDSGPVLKAKHRKKSSKPKSIA